MHIEGIDLNLLVVLHTLLEERHVSRAAGRLGLSQPAVSHALARLRDVLGDPLLVRTPGGMSPTPRGQALQEPLRLWVTHAQRLVAPPEAFDPARTEGTLRIGANDYVGLALLPALLRRLARLAPLLKVEVRGHEERLPVGALTRGTLDLGFGPTPEPKGGLQQRKLFKDDFVCLTWKEHPKTRRRLTLKEYLAHDHVLISPFGGFRGMLDDALEKKGMERTVRVAVAQFAVAPLLLPGTDRILTLPRRPARELVRSAPELTLHDCPLPVEGFPFYLFWAERTQDDPLHRWVREQVVASLEDGPP